MNNNIDIDKGYIMIDICDRCGREGHNIKKCYAKTNIQGQYIDEECVIL
jgi:hypothetical protein